MHPQEFKYILELQTYAQKANRPFERRHFHNLHEALINLLQIPADRYWEAPDARDGKRISTVLLLEQRQGEEQEIGYTFQLPMADALDIGPSAGVYFQNTGIGDDDNITALEGVLGANFNALRSYDPGLPMVQLARFVYDDGLSLITDPALKEVIDDLQRMSPEPWLYQLKVRDGSNPISGNLYYHSTLPAAFDHLISLPYFTPEPNGYPGSFLEHYPTIEIYAGDSVRELSIPLFAKQQSHDLSQTMLKVEMEVTGGLGRFETIAGVNLSEFDGYRFGGSLLALGNINTHDDTFIPVPAFTELQQGTGPLGPPRETVASAYTLQLEYRPANWPVHGPAINSPEFATQTYPDLSAAVAAMHNLQPEAFDAAAAVKNEKDKFLHEATIYHTADKYEVATMFRIARSLQHVPAGVYVKVNAENLSAETLGALKPFVQEMANKAPLLYLVKADDGQQQASDRRRPPGPRYFGDSGGRGIK